MAIRDEIQPKQIVTCDLCGSDFERSLNKGSFFGASDIWEPVSIWISPHIPNSQSPSLFGGGITIEHACLPCRQKFVKNVRLLIDHSRQKEPTQNGQ